MIIFVCLGGWISSILWITKANQQILKEIKEVSIRLSSLEERLKEKPPLKQEGEIKPPLEPSRQPQNITPLKPSICKIAIILDDGGYSLSDDTISLIKKGFPLTVSIIPFLPYSKETAEIVYKNKGEVMVHLPMEAENNGKEKMVITSSMEKEKIKDLTYEAISNIPHCVGVNNHKGSKATADKAIMEPVLEVVKEKNLYFVDSVTTPKSIAYKLASEMGIPSEKRDIFIDNNTSDVRSYFYKLIKIAKKQGSAIGIGHIYKKATIAVLRDELPDLEKHGIELVPVSAIVK